MPVTKALHLPLKRCPVLRRHRPRFRPAEILDDRLPRGIFSVPLAVGVVPSASMPFVLPQTLARTPPA